MKGRIVKYHSSDGTEKYGLIPNNEHLVNGKAVVIPLADKYDPILKNEKPQKLLVALNKIQLTGFQD